MISNREKELATPQKRQNHREQFINKIQKKKRFDIVKLLGIIIWTYSQKIAQFPIFEETHSN